MAIALSKAIGQDWLANEKVTYYFCCVKLPVPKVGIPNWR